MFDHFESTREAFLAGQRFQQDFSLREWRQGGLYASAAWNKIRRETLSKHGIDPATLASAETETMRLHRAWQDRIEAALDTLESGNPDGLDYPAAIGLLLHEMRELADSRAK